MGTIMKLSLIVGLVFSLVGTLLFASLHNLVGVAVGFVLSVTNYYLLIIKKEDDNV